MYQEFIDVLSFLVGGTPSAPVTSFGIWMVITIVAAATALITYKFAYIAGSEGSKPAAIVGLLVKA